METDKRWAFDKEGILLSLGAICLGTVLYTAFELVGSKGKFNETTVYKIPTEVPQSISMLIEDNELFASREDKVCDKLRDKISTSFNMRTKYIKEEKPDLISLYSYLNSLNGADGSVMVDFEQNDCKKYGQSKANDRLRSSMQEFDETIREEYPQVSNMMDVFNSLKK